MSSLKSTQLELKIPTSYLYEPTKSSKSGILVLHGFSDTAQRVKRRLLGEEPVSDYHVFVPNGFFPSPTKRENEFKEGYAWYFRDPVSGNQMISPEFTAQSLIKLIQQEGLGDLTWTLIGFSQGGFFAPFLVKAGLSCKKIIGVGAAYRLEAYEGLSNLEVHGIHGEKDLIVGFEYAQASFQALKEQGIGKSFFSLPGVAHTLNDSGRKIIRDLLSSK